MSGVVPLLRADPHNWGSELVHMIDEERDQTLCGKSPGGCPGTKFYAAIDSITCKKCIGSIEAKARHAEAEARNAERQREWEQKEREREADKHLWWQHYNTYLRSQTWRDKRALVMRRAAGLCEGCGARRVTQVHHRQYSRGCSPGSSEWVAQEKLFNPIAIRDASHIDVHFS